MKKLMIAACVITFAVVAQATTYSWKINTYATETGSEDIIGINSLVYFFDGANGSYDATGMSNLLSTDKDWATKMGANIGTTLSAVSGDNVINASGSINTIDGQSGLYSKGVVNAYMVMFNSETLADATKFYITARARISSATAPIFRVRA